MANRIFSTLTRALEAGRLKRREVVALERIADALDRAIPKLDVTIAPSPITITRANLSRIAIRQKLATEARRKGLDPGQVKARIDEILQHDQAAKTKTTT